MRIYRDVIVVAAMLLLAGCDAGCILSGGCNPDPRFAVAKAKTVDSCIRADTSVVQYAGHTIRVIRFSHDSTCVAQGGSGR